MPLSEKDQLESVLALKQALEEERQKRKLSKDIVEKENLFIKEMLSLTKANNINLKEEEGILKFILRRIKAERETGYALDKAARKSLKDIADETYKQMLRNEEKNSDSSRHSRFFKKTDQLNDPQQFMIDAKNLDFGKIKKRYEEHYYKDHFKDENPKPALHECIQEKKLKNKPCISMRFETSEDAGNYWIQEAKEFGIDLSILNHKGVPYLRVTHEGKMYQIEENGNKEIDHKQFVDLIENDHKKEVESFQELQNKSTSSVAGSQPEDPEDKDRIEPRIP